MLNIKSGILLLLLLLLTASAHATTFICTCLCSAREFAKDETEQNCKDWCVTQMALQGGASKVCPVGRFEFTEFNKSSVWIIIGSIIGGCVLFFGCCFSACWYSAKRQRRAHQGSNVFGVQQQPVGGAASYTAPTTYVKAEQAPPSGFYQPPSQPPPIHEKLGTYRA
ncbi:hypothetical protein BJ741DRAFT_662057 [Chytriomyces cf. hyalinus JEL632]|nr:hypothetical protein BJ741DRAFT_662057 [Chytriomyces cf. hyalinus JEL632]